ncbi:MAG TPA: hypothetical protein DCR77_10890 [Flavobacteriaceae bacterium]|nr:hypothetical protein [Flavobacteriaceae bacterium]
MKISIEEAKNKLFHIHTILIHINIYKSYLEKLFETDYNNEFNGRHLDFLFFIYCKLLIIDLNKLVYDCNKEKLNLFKISRSFNSTFKFNIDYSLLEENKDILETIKEYRDKEYAHFDLNEDKRRFFIEDAFKIVDLLNILVKEISSKFNQGFNIDDVVINYNLFSQILDTFKVNKVKEILLISKTNNLPHDISLKIISAVINSKSVEQVRSFKKMLDE